jgi:rubrerythrin
MSWAKTNNLEEMIGIDVRMERGDVENDTEHAKLAEEPGLTEVTIRLEEMAADEARHARKLTAFFEGFKRRAELH